MLQNVGNIYSIAAENKPMEKSTISNVIYETDNYRYTCYSMGKATSFMPERHQFIGLVIVDEGKLIVQAKDGDEWHNIEVVKDQVFLRPAYQLIGFKAETDCVFVEFDFPIGSEMAEDLYPEKPFNILDLTAFKNDTGVNRRAILNGKEFRFEILAYSKGYLRPEKKWASGMVHVYKGSLDILREGKHLFMKEGQNMVTNADDIIEVAALEDTVLTTFYHLPVGN